jgi:hypothetical protein
MAVQVTALRDRRAWVAREKKRELEGLKRQLRNFEAFQNRFAPELDTAPDFILLSAIDNESYA